MMVGMSTYVVIPARGGSKGITTKNLRRVGGVPLVERTICAALSSSLVDRVFVTTDDPAIAEVAARAGAEVVDRPAAIAGDDATSESAVLHVLDTLREQGEPDPDLVLFMQCTSPLTTAAEIDGTIEVLEREGADCSFTGSRSHAFLWRRGPDGAEPVNHDVSERLRRQDQPVELADTGAVYAMRTAGLRRNGRRFFGRIAIHEVPREHELEIDEPVDLALAELLVRQAEAAVRAERLPERVAGLALDFDGVLTDNRVMTFPDGTEAVSSDRADGMGIEMLRGVGIPMVVLSKEQHPVVAARCRKLGLDHAHGIDDKSAAFRAWMDEHELDPATVVFVGNDVNDVECLELAGCGVAVADAHPAAAAAADIILSRPGGRGAVRELAELILSHRKGA